MSIPILRFADLVFRLSSLGDDWWTRDLRDGPGVRRLDKAEECPRIRGAAGCCAEPADAKPLSGTALAERGSLCCHALREACP